MRVELDKRLKYPRIETILDLTVKTLIAFRCYLPISKGLMLIIVGLS